MSADNSAVEQNMDHTEKQIADETELLDAGEVSDSDSTYFYNSGEYHDKTASRLAIIILCIFTGSFVIHYTVTAILISYTLQDTAEHLSKLFEIWLPLISGFTGSTVTYYFTREKR